MKPLCQKVTDYWRAFYYSPSFDLCSLCGNRGIIDTQRTAVSPLGYRPGRIDYCICPNGQHARKDQLPLL